MESSKIADQQLMFSRIANRYRLTNHILSLFLDIYWRRKTISILKPLKCNQILDLACGGGELTKELVKLQPENITAIDISDSMLKNARKQKYSSQTKVSFIQADANKIPFSDNSFQLVTISFGLRNFENPESVFKEITRVLSEGGTLAILEFKLPSNFILKQLFKMHLKFVVPTIGGLFSGSTAPYRYLAESIVKFSETDLSKKLNQSGFQNIKSKILFPGICQLITATVQHPETKQ